MGVKLQKNTGQIQVYLFFLHTDNLVRPESYNLRSFRSFLPISSIGGDKSSSNLRRASYTPVIHEETTPSATTMNRALYEVIERGSLHTLDYRIFFKGPQGALISPWHDIPLFADAANKVVSFLGWCWWTANSSQAYWGLIRVNFLMSQISNLTHHPPRMSPRR